MRRMRTHGRARTTSASEKGTLFCYDSIADDVRKARCERERREEANL